MSYPPGSITTDPDWNEKYNAARNELERARAQYDRAESLLAVATSGLNKAQAEVSRLFKKRMSDLEAESSARELARHLNAAADTSRR